MVRATMLTVATLTESKNFPAPSSPLATGSFSLDFPSRYPVRWSLWVNRQPNLFLRSGWPCNADSY